MNKLFTYCVHLFKSFNKLTNILNMSKETTAMYQDALGKLRSELQLHRGYGSRIARRLKVHRQSVYAVAWGRAKNPVILKALIDEAKQGQQDASMELISSYLKAA